MQRSADDLPLFAWTPPPVVVLFPATRRRAFIRKNAAHAAGMSEKGANNWLAHLLAKHRERLARIGVDRVAAEADAAALERALRVEMARMVADWGGVA